MQQYRLFLMLIFVCGMTFCLQAQLSVDTIPNRANESADQVADSVTVRSDRSDTVAITSSIVFRPELIWDSFRVLPPGSIVVAASDGQPGERHESNGKEGLFYALLGMVLGLALFRRFFHKYWNDLFRLFFRTTLRQRQLRDQLQLASLPSILLNIFFFLCLSFYVSLFLTERGWNPFSGYWLFWLLTLGGVVGMYLVKWLGLHFAAWIFGQDELGDDYSFLVFTVNKMMGLLLLPSVIGIAFAEGRVWELSLLVSWILIGGLLLYRGYLTFRVVRRQAAVSPFHFFLYWVGFELAPLLVLYRFLIGFFGEMT